MSGKEVSPASDNYIEGPEAARRFEKVVQHALSVTPAELKRRHEIWEKARKANRKKSR